MMGGSSPILGAGAHADGGARPARRARRCGAVCSLRLTWRPRHRCGPLAITATGSSAS